MYQVANNSKVTSKFQMRCQGFIFPLCPWTNLVWVAYTIEMRMIFSITHASLLYWFLTAYLLNSSLKSLFLLSTLLLMCKLKHEAFHNKRTWIFSCALEKKRSSIGNKLSENSWIHPFMGETALKWYLWNKRVELNCW